MRLLQRAFLITCGMPFKQKHFAYMIFLVVSRKEIAQVKSKIRKIDDKAFVVVVDAHETYGDGFKKFEADDQTTTE